MFRRGLLLGTNNPGKLRELRELLSPLPLELYSPAELGLAVFVPEDGQTLEENALAKARAYAQASGLPAVADDSGLEVKALGGRPGVHTARYGGEGLSDAERRRLLLRELLATPWEARQARFRCVLALWWCGQEYLVEGVLDGFIALEERGTGGFGYDPIFFVPELGRTLAELSAEEKNAISHRGRAGQNMRALLLRLLARDCPEAQTQQG
jgi:XTP/dITP diphosphohydrolase